MSAMAIPAFADQPYYPCYEGTWNIRENSGTPIKLKISNVRLRESEINFVFCERVLYVGTAPEQKTESAKNGKDSMSLAFLQSLRVQQVAPTSLCKGGKKVF